MEVMSPQLLALFTALSYATANVSVRLGLKHSTATTATVTSLTCHTAILWSAVFLTGGIPEVPTAAILAITVAGVLQPVMRFCHYMGIDKVGASRAVTLRNSYPILSVIVAIMVLHEEVSISSLVGTLSVVIGVIFTSWKLERQLRSYHWWHLIFPLGTALITGVAHPIRRYAMTLSDEPLFFAALVGIISFVCFAGYIALPFATESLVWHPKSLIPFLVAGLFETLGVLLILTAFTAGPVVTVSPIVGTSPIWTVLLAAVFLRDVERISIYTVIGTLCVVTGVIAISLGG